MTDGTRGGAEGKAVGAGREEVGAAAVLPFMVAAPAEAPGEVSRSAASSADTTSVGAHVDGDTGSAGELEGGTAPGDGEGSLDKEKTTNMTKGEKDPLGRNAAEGSKPSGSDKAHDSHKEAVEKTRSGSEKQNSKDRIPTRG